jgi:phosphoribosyl-ATP pyrophosphohydrolase
MMPLLVGPKLVRDLVPLRIAREGFVAVTTRILPSAFGRHVALKICEEAAELRDAHASGDRENMLAEAADVADAFAAYRKHVGISLFALWCVRIRKWRTHGRFTKHIMLLDIREKE